MWSDHSPLRLHLAIGSLIWLAIIASAAHPVYAQTAGLSVTIARPGEGEVVYAGPATLLYSLSVTGWISLRSGSPEDIRLTLQVLSGGSELGTLTSQPRPDGTFSFPVTVNPDKTAEELTDRLNLSANAGCISGCHHASDLGLPAGQLVLRVIAIAPAGQRAIDERHITVDRAGYASVPVQLVLASTSNQNLANVPVTGSARMYMWRARNALTQTDDRGWAELKVETLAYAPTHYLVRVEPVIVDGALYESTTPVEVDLAPGATTAPPITLEVRRTLGQINGSLTPATDVTTVLSSIDVRAIRLSDGVSYAARTTLSGTFDFGDVPIARYLISADRDALAAQGLSSADQTIELARSITATVDLPVALSVSRPIHGTLRSVDGRLLPFGWVESNELQMAAPVEPGSSSWALPIKSDESISVVAVAPGYFSQAQGVQPSPTMSDLAVQLTPRPDTQLLKWGSGAIVVPSESEAAVDGHNVVLDRGWLWGQGDDSAPWMITTAGVVIVIQRGSFALENVPGQTAWLYVFEGEAQVHRVDQPEQRVIVPANSMTMLSDKVQAAVVPIERAVIDTFHSASDSAPISPVWEQSASARLRDGLALAGITAAQVVTFVTYILVLMSLLLIPFAVIRLWMRRHAKVQPGSGH
jgi:hypothetical protein